MYKSLLGDVLALKRAIVVSMFQTVYSAHLQENAGLLSTPCKASNITYFTDRGLKP